MSKVTTITTDAFRTIKYSIPFDTVTDFFLSHNNAAYNVCGLFNNVMSNTCVFQKKARENENR